MIGRSSLVSKQTRSCLWSRALFQRSQKRINHIDETTACRTAISRSSYNKRIQRHTMFVVCEALHQLQRWNTTVFFVMWEVLCSLSTERCVYKQLLSSLSTPFIHLHLSSCSSKVSQKRLHETKSSFLSSDSKLKASDTRSMLPSCAPSFFKILRLTAPALAGGTETCV